MCQTNAVRPAAPHTSLPQLHVHIWCHPALPQHNPSCNPASRSCATLRAATTCTARPWRSGRGWTRQARSLCFSASHGAVKLAAVVALHHISSCFAALSVYNLRLPEQCLVQVIEGADDLASQFFLKGVMNKASLC